MVFFVVFLDALQAASIVSSIDGSFDRYGLEAALQSAESFSIYFLYSLNVVAPMTCTSPLDKARLEDICGIHSAFAVACADKVMNLVDEQDYVSGGLYLVDKGLSRGLSN